MSQSVGLVVPAYRPDPPQLRAYLESLEATVEPDTIRVELDDPTGSYTGLGESLDVEVSSVPRRRGKGLAITSGFEALDTDVMAFVDADGSTIASSVVDILTPLVNGEAAVSVASRHHPDASVTGRSSMRRFMSGGFATLASQATGIELSDFQCGAKAITDDCWDDIRTSLFESGFGWDLEVLWVATKQGYPIAEIPVDWRESDGSTVPPLRTAGGLLWLLGRLMVARIRRTDSWNDGATPLVEQVPAIDQ